jgi:hypothetical protein
MLLKRIDTSVVREKGDGEKKRNTHGAHALLLVVVCFDHRAISSPREIHRAKNINVSTGMNG